MSTQPDVPTPFFFIVLNFCQLADEYMWYQNLDYKSFLINIYSITPSNIEEGLNFYIRLKYEASLGLLKCYLETFQFHYSSCVERHVPELQVSGIIVACYCGMYENLGPENAKNTWLLIATVFVS